MQEKPRDEWMGLFIEDNGVAAHPYQTAEEALSDPDMVANGHVIALDGTKQLGPLARLTETPAAIGQEVAGETWKVPAASEAPDTRAPLRNVTVVELATIIAAPLAASFLADLGARVIKVETPGGDPYRNMAAGFGAIRCNQGKESIGVDLKAEEGRAIVHKLIAEADILVHNFRPGVPERLGISYEQLSAINPKLIYISANGYGAEGPSGQRPSTHPIPGAALGGAGYQAGGTPQDLLDLSELRETARRLMRANEVNPDPNTAMVICTSALLGLIARMRTGKGQQIFGDMFIANAYANFDDCISFDGKRPRRPLMPNLLGVHPLRRLYECETGWIFLGINRLEDWERFCELVDARHLLSHYPKPGEFPPDVLNDELAQLFSTETATHWEDLLLTKGIGCVIADRYNLSEMLSADCHDKSEWMVQVEHEDIGSYYRPRPMLEFSRSRLHPVGSVKGGANTRALVSEVGYEDDAIESLYEKGVLWTSE
jgi:crotonobetainyl-CoA:carnitine CoA-transferase CaiB-like acyl-CoA transferase